MRLSVLGVSALKVFCGQFKRRDGENAETQRALLVISMSSDSLETLLKLALVHFPTGLVLTA